MSQSENETQIRALIENWAKAARAQDMDGVLAEHADDIVMFDVPPPLQSRGIQEYKETWTLFFAHSQGGRVRLMSRSCKLPRTKEWRSATPS